MKAVIYFLIATLMSPTFSFAGSLVQQTNQTCYVLKGESPTPEMPKQVCIQSIVIENPWADSASVRISSDLKAESTYLNYATRRNENGYSFEVGNVLLDDGGRGCDYTEKVTLSIMGRADNDGLVDVSLLKVTAEYETMVDSCHSNPRVSQFEYIKK